MPIAHHYNPAPVFTDLGDGFYDPVKAARFPTHRLHYRNNRWAARVGLSGLDDQEWIEHFGAFAPLPDNLSEPLALRYHGHQFRVYNPNLGDGRGFLFAQLRDSADGRLLDLGTKGSGTTPYSRGGDGRLTLKGGVREILATEMLETLGVYTSKSFSLIETGEQLIRGDEPSPTRSAVLLRLSHSHVRFGSFQRHAYIQDRERIQRLVAFTVAHYFPELNELEGNERTTAFFIKCIDNTARLGASWMVAGFIHGVLNTDNMVVTGESFDYGPWRFLPNYDPGFTAAYFDQTGLYAFGEQPSALAWNLNQLGDALSQICDVETLNTALEKFPDKFQAALQDHLLQRLGLIAVGEPDHMTLVERIFEFLDQTGISYERLFFDWYGGLNSETRAARSPDVDKYTGPQFDAFKAALKNYKAARPDALSHAYFQAEHPCTMLIDEVEQIWAAIAENDDWSRFSEKLLHITQMGDALGNVPRAD